VVKVYLTSFGLICDCEGLINVSDVLDAGDGWISVILVLFLLCI